MICFDWPLFKLPFESEALGTKSQKLILLLCHNRYDCFNVLKDKLYMLQEILSQNFVFIDI